MALESYKRRKARIEDEQAPTVEEGVYDWQSHYWQAPQECDCYECGIRRARRDKAKRQAMDRPDRSAMGEQV